MRIRVLQVLASLRRAGAERVAVSIATRLDGARFEAAVVSLYGAFPGGFEPRLPVWRLDKRRGADPRMWPRLMRVFREFRPDIVHTHSYVLRYALPARWLTGGGAIVHTVHNLADREVGWGGRMLHRAAFRAGTVPVAVSEEVARSFRAMYGFAPAVIPNGTDVRCGFRPEAGREWRARHGFGPEDIVIASVGRFEPQKNPLGLIEAFARGLGARPWCHLALAGEGSLLEPARKMAFAGRVHFTGLCRDVPEMLSGCDLFALASHWEGQPVAVIEAMAAHLPVLATAVGGVPELVEDGVTGVLVPPGDMEALARAMAELAGDAARRRTMAEAAAARAVRFDSEAMVAAYAGLYERL